MEGLGSSPENIELMHQQGSESGEDQDCRYENDGSFGTLLVLPTASVKKRGYVNAIH